MTNFNLTNSDWDSPMADFLPANYDVKVSQFLSEIYQGDKLVFPKKNRVFFAFQKTKLTDTKVVILGQDPYHEVNQAQGLAFSVPEEVPAPPSLKNILKEVALDLGQERKTHDLTSWADQGVLLLNTVLTVEEGKANAHQKMVWEPLTDAAIQVASQDDQPKVFILWGNSAQKKEKLINHEKHFVIKSAHPSPLSAYRGFFESKPFTKANEFLKSQNRQLINWLQ